MAHIDPQRFERLAEDALNQIEEALSDDEALDVHLAMGVLMIKFEDGERFVINSHRAARQIWMAAGATAWHFDYDGVQWVAAKSQDELFSRLQSLMTEKLGRQISVNPN